MSADNEIEILRTEVTALRADLAAAKATCAELVTDGNAITLAASLAKKSIECAQLRADLAAVKQAGDARLETLRSISNSREDALERVSQLTREVVKLRADLAAKEAALNDLRAQIAITTVPVLDPNLIAALEHAEQSAALASRADKGGAR